MSYQLFYPPDIRRLCIGETKAANLAVIARVQVPGDSTLGTITTRGVRVSASSDNPAILVVNEAETPAPDFGNPASIEYTFSGISAGSTSVSIDAIVQGNPLHQSVPVQVVPCQDYTVDVNSTWLTTISNATLLLNVTLHAVLAADANGVFTDYPNVQWDATVNRLKGCLPDHETFNTLRGNGGSVQGEITDDAFSLTIAVRELIAGVLFDCPGHIINYRVASGCPYYLDGMCSWMNPNPTFVPDPITVRIPFNGGTITVPQRLTDSQGSADGHATITLTASGTTNQGTPLGMIVQGNGTGIASGDDTPSVTDDTDFGTTSAGMSVTHTFTIFAISTDLTLGTLSVPDGFTLTRTPTTPVMAGNFTTFVVQCDAANAGTFSGTVSIANNDSSQNPYSFAVTCQVNAPEIDVKGNGISIVSGDDTPSMSDGTDLGTTLVGTPITHTFSILNTGTADLTLGGVTVPVEFTVTRAPISPVKAGSSTSFDVQCNQDVAVTISATVSIASNDSAANPYTFRIVCHAVNAPEIDVQDNGVSIVSGDTTPSASDGTDFGTTLVGTSGVHSYTIRNTGTAELELLDITLPAGFSFVSLRNVHVPAANSLSLTVHCDAVSPGAYSGTVSIVSNDPMQNPYTFAITCQVTGVPEMNVIGNSTSIASGAATPNVTDGTDFSSTLVGTPVGHSFYILNAGSDDLTVGAVIVPAGFTLTQVPNTLVTEGRAAGFAVQCNAASTGIYSGTVVIPNNDSQANPYTFTITCQVNALAPQIAVRGQDDISIANGDTTPSASDGTDFGTTLVGTSILEFYYISNVGSADLTLGTISLPDGFVLDRPLSLVPPGNIRNTFFKVTCNAASAGTYSGTVFIANNDPDANPYTFAVTCQVNARAAQIAVGGRNDISIANGDTTPSASDGTDFGTTLVGAQVLQNFYIHNTGSAALTLGAISVPDGFVMYFPPYSPMPPGNDDSFELLCDAESPGMYSGTVVIPNGDSQANPYSFAVTCQVNARAAQIAVGGWNDISIANGDTTPSASDGTDFGTPPDARGLHSFYIHNTGSAALTLGAITMPAGFVMYAPHFYPVPPGNSTSFDLLCDAESPGTYSGTVSIPNNDNQANPYTFAVTCQVNDTTTQMAVLGHDISIASGDTTPSASDGTDFGTMLVGAQNHYAFFTIRNTGDAELRLGAISVPAGFSMTTPPTLVPPGPGNFVGLDLLCDAVSPGTYSGTVSIPNNDPDANPYTFAVTCQVNALAPAIQVRGNSHIITSNDVSPIFADGTRFATTTVGTPVIQNFNILNTGRADLTVGAVTVPAGFTLTRVPATPVTAGNFTTLAVQCNAASAGTYSGTVSIASNDPTQNPYTFTITCQVNSHSIGKGANS